MQNTIHIGRRILPIEQIALIEPFDSETQKNMRSDRAFKAQIVLLNRDSILSETDPLALAEEHAFRFLLKDNVATNLAINFGVETFEAAPEFQPSKPFVSRRLWRDQNGNTQSKLLLTDVEDLISAVVRGQDIPVQAPDKPAGRVRRRRHAVPQSVPET